MKGNLKGFWSYIKYFDICQDRYGAVSHLSIAAIF